ncbi:DUF2946 family protein [Limnohabitans sp.]|jgi:hypothetical protein|uniref:DUF2946 family protein n=1 Tax=Limnohabitans sp. TaxID=1907725 RepID=UPI001B56ECF9|nr:DUF2946 family protein [Limnohabitans sp.]MBP6220678.1 DUF2946 family protein [Limnohabitans sp.]MBP6246289.1 DUF2946 family protein [Limnohabitans sp.]
MFSLQSLRNAHHLTRFMLVWFALFIGVAAASPLVNPEGVQLVCTTAGSVKLVQAAADGQDGTDNTHGMHCPLCLPVAAPPVAATPVAVHAGLSFALQSTEQARLAALIGLPWQARAPPVIF